MLRLPHGFWLWAAGFGFAALGFLTPGNAALAQGVDPNIQSRIDEFAIRPVDPIVESKTVTIQTPVFETVRKQVPLSLTRQKQLLNTAMQKSGDKSLMTLTDKSREDLRPLFSKYGIPSSRVETSRRQTGVKTQKIVTPRKIEAVIAATGSYGFESNATKSNIDKRADGVAAAGGSFQLKVPVGPDEKEGTILLYGSTTSVRYTTLTARDFDLSSAGGTFSTTIWKTPNARADGLTTRDILSFGVEESTTYRPTFEAATVNLVTPSFSWTRSNIPLSSETCGTGILERYCLFGSLRMIVKHTVADVVTVDNTSARFEAALGWVTPVSGLIATVTAGVQENHYVHVVGGREDFTADIAGRLEWGFAPGAILSGTLKYTYVTSSVRRVSWDGLAATPQLKLSWKF